MEIDEGRSTGGNNEVAAAPSPLAVKEMTPDAVANGMAVDHPAAATES
jgi:hypothetical protein